MSRHARLAATGLVAAALTLSGLGLVTVPARSASPQSGSIDAANPEVRWQGTITAQWAGTVSGAGCQLAVPDPTCDTFELTVGPLDAPAAKPGNGHGHGHGHAKRSDGPSGLVNDLQVSIVPTAGSSGIVELDVYLYDTAGVEVARDTELGRAELLVHDIPAGVYVVAVQSELSTDPSSAYQALARAVAAGEPAELDPESSCGLEGTPGGPPDDIIGLNGIIGDPTAVADGVDLGEAISLDVLVILDGVPLDRATDIFARAARSYAALNIELNLAATVDHSFATDDGLALIRQAKELVGGARPAGIDIVEVLTAKDIQQLNQYAIAGIADCIGGVAHDDRAFLVAEAYTPEDIAVGPLVFDAGASANVTAHEIGHLMGGQHHYANCVEGVSPSDVRDDGSIEVSPCTLMFNAADFLGHNFDTLNGRIVRGHAIRYAG